MKKVHATNSISIIIHIRKKAKASVDEKYLNNLIRCPSNFVHFDPSGTYRNVKILWTLEDSI